jgi:hypothetical protein
MVANPSTLENWEKEKKKMHFRFAIVQLFNMGKKIILGCPC